MQQLFVIKHGSNVALMALATSSCTSSSGFGSPTLYRIE
jgi:hypothetical protein